MAKSKFFSLWGAQASGDGSETEEERTARLQAEARKKADEEARARAESGDDDGEDEDDEEDEDEEDGDTDEERRAKRARNALRGAGHRRGVHAERERIFAIVNGVGAERVTSALQVAFNTNMAAAAAIAMVKTLPPDAGAQGGKIGLAGAMSTRRQSVLGPAGGGDGIKGDEVEQAAAQILAFATHKTMGADK